MRKVIVKKVVDQTTYWEVAVYLDDAIETDNTLELAKSVARMFIPGDKKTDLKHIFVKKTKDTLKDEFTFLAGTSNTKNLQEVSLLANVQPYSASSMPVANDGIEAAAADIADNETNKIAHLFKEEFNESALDDFTTHLFTKHAIVSSHFPISDKNYSTYINVIENRFNLPKGSLSESFAIQEKEAVTLKYQQALNADLQKRTQDIDQQIEAYEAKLPQQHKKVLKQEILELEIFTQEMVTSGMKSNDILNALTREMHNRKIPTDEIPDILSILLPKTSNDSAHTVAHTSSKANEANDSAPLNKDEYIANQLKEFHDFKLSFLKLKEEINASRDGIITELTIAITNHPNQVQLLLKHLDYGNPPSQLARVKGLIFNAIYEAGNKLISVNPNTPQMAAKLSRALAPFASVKSKQTEAQLSCTTTIKLEKLAQIYAKKIIEQTAKNSPQRAIQVYRFNEKFHPFARIHLNKDSQTFTISYNTTNNYKEKMKEVWQQIHAKNLKKQSPEDEDAAKAACDDFNKQHHFVNAKMENGQPQFQFQTIASITLTKAIKFFIDAINATKLHSNTRTKAITKFNKIFSPYAALYLDNTIASIKFNKVTFADQATKIKASDAAKLFNASFKEAENIYVRAKCDERDARKSPESDSEITNQFREYKLKKLKEFSTTYEKYLSIDDDAVISYSQNIPDHYLEEENLDAGSKEIDLQAIDLKTLEYLLAYCIESCSQEKLDTKNITQKLEEVQALLNTELSLLIKDIQSSDPKTKKTKLPPIIQVKAKSVEFGIALFHLERLSEQCEALGKYLAVPYGAPSEYTLTDLGAAVEEFLKFQAESNTSKLTHFKRTQHELNALELTSIQTKTAIEETSELLSQSEDQRLKHSNQMSCAVVMAKRLASIKQASHPTGSLSVGEPSYENQAKTFNNNLEYFLKSLSWKDAVAEIKTSLSSQVQSKFTNPKLLLEKRIGELKDKHATLLTQLKVSEQNTLLQKELKDVTDAIALQLKQLTETIQKVKKILTLEVEGLFDVFEAQYEALAKTKQIETSEFKEFENTYTQIQAEYAQITQVFDQFALITQVTDNIEKAITLSSHTLCDQLTSELRDKVESIDTRECSSVVSVALKTRQEKENTSPEAVSANYQKINSANVKEVLTLFNDIEKALPDTKQNLQAIKPIVKTAKDKQLSKKNNLVENLDIDEPLPSLLKNGFGTHIDAEIQKLDLLDAQILTAKQNYYTKLLCHIVTSCIINLDYWATHAGKKKTVVSKGHVQYEISSAVAILLSHIKSSKFEGWQTDTAKAHALLTDLRKIAVMSKGYNVTFKSERPADQDIDTHTIYIYLNSENAFEFVAKDYFGNVITKPFLYSDNSIKRDSKEEPLSVYMDAHTSILHCKTRITKNDGTIEVVDKPLSDKELEVYQQISDKCKKPGSGKRFDLFNNDQKLDETICEVTKRYGFRSSNDYNKNVESTRALYEWLAQLPTDTNPTAFASNAHTFAVQAVNGVHASNVPGKTSIDDAFPKQNVINHAVATKENSFAFVDSTELKTIKLSDDNIAPRESIIGMQPIAEQDAERENPAPPPAPEPAPVVLTTSGKSKIPTWLKVLGYIGLGLAGLVLAGVVVGAVIYTAPASIPFIASLGVVIAAKAGVFGATAFTAAGITVTAETAIGAGLLTAILTIPFTLAVYGIKKGFSKLFSRFSESKSSVIIEELPEETPEKPHNDNGNDPSKPDVKLTQDKHPSLDLDKMPEPDNSDNTPPVLPNAQSVVSNINTAPAEGGLSESQVIDVIEPPHDTFSILEKLNQGNNNNNSCITNPDKIDAVTQPQSSTGSTPPASSYKTENLVEKEKAALVHNALHRPPQDNNPSKDPRHIEVIHKPSKKKN